MHSSARSLDQINIIVRDMEASVAFYRRLGLEIDAAPGSQHVTVRLANGLDLEFDSADFAAQGDSGDHGPTGSGVVIGFSQPSREAVDEALRRPQRCGRHRSPAAL
jgi:catechol 2,3-dioxygenase-like lactoylglutathione lyase family enzyme